MAGFMYMVAGLGNPGVRYAATRHNLGFRVVDGLAARAGLRWRRSWRQGAHWARWSRTAGDVLLVKPQAYMNRSGGAVAALLRYYRLEARRLLVVYDDLDLGLGTLRLRPQGSAGSHNGLASVLTAVGGNAVPRLRLGVGPCPAGRDRATFVLSAFGSGEQEAVETMVQQAVEAVKWVLRDGVERAMNKINASSAAPERGATH